MKKDEYKKAIDEIKINPVEKAKIYNNIQSHINSKKKINIPFSILGFTMASIIIGILVFFPSGTFKSFVSGNTQLENSYSKEIIVNATQYMAKNEVTVEEGGSVKIPASSIINDEKYNVCKGNLIVKNENGSYSYSTDIKCSGKSTETTIKNYKLVAGTSNYAYILDDGIIVVSSISEKRLDSISSQLISNDLLLVKYDVSGNEVWRKSYRKHSEYESYLEPISIEKIGNNYVLLTAEHYDLNIYEDNSSSTSLKYMISVINSKGKIKSTQEFEDSSYLSLINKYNDALYYRKATSDEESIVKLSISDEKAKIETISYSDKLLNQYKNKALARYVTDKEIYGTIDNNIVFRIDSNNNVVYNDLSKENYADQIKEIISTNDYVYVAFKDTKVIVKLDKKLDFINEIDFKEYDSVFFESVDEDELNINTTKEYVNYLITLSKEDKETAKYELDNSNLGGFVYLNSIKKFKSNYIQVYLKDSDNNSQVLLIFDIVK